MTLHTIALALIPAVLGLVSCAPVTRPGRERPPAPVAPAPPMPPPEPEGEPAGPPPPREAPPPEYAAREQRAREHLNQGDLATALLEWKLLTTLAPERRDFAKQVATITTRIRQRTAKHLASGEKALAEEDFETAKLEFLKVLALNPHYRAALVRLREIEKIRITAVQVAKLEKMAAKRARRAEARKEATLPAALVSSGNGQERDYLETGIAFFRDGDYESSILEIGKYLRSYPNDALAREYFDEAQSKLKEQTGGMGETNAEPVAEEETGVAEEALGTYSEGEKTMPQAQEGIALEAAPDEPVATGTTADEKNKVVAQDLYEKGVRVYRKDIQRAIEYWERSLAHDPQHLQARIKLEQAYKMKERLKRLEDD